MSFETVWKQVKPISFLGESKARVLYDLCKETLNRLPSGDLAECGVFMGGTAAMLGSLLKNESGTRKLWLFDSFSGLPEVDSERDCYYARGGMSGEGNDLLQITNQVLKWHSLESKVRIRKGWFRKTLADLPRSAKFSFVHVDCDIYSSTKTCLRFLYPRLLDGGVMVFDDYFDIGGGQRLAVKEFLKKTGDQLFAGWPQQAYIIKGRKPRPADKRHLVYPPGDEVPVQVERLLKNRSGLRGLRGQSRDIGIFYPNPATIKFILQMQKSAAELDGYFDALFKKAFSPKNS